MASPQCYQDDDRPPWGSPRLYGDMTELAGQTTGTYRHRKPSESSRKRMHMRLIIAACHDAGLSAKIVAGSLGITDRHVRRIYLAKSKAKGRRS